MNLPYTIVKENLKVLGAYMKGVAVGVSAMAIAIVNKVIGSKIDNSYSTKTEHVYEEHAIKQGYSIGKSLILAIVIAMVMIYFIPVAGKIYITIQVAFIAYHFTTTVAYELTRDIVNFYNREVCHTNQ